MAPIPEYVLLALYHLLFFWPIYSKLFRQATSEVISTFFPHWIWIGRKLRKRETWLEDRIYYQYPGAIPFLSSFYPPHLLSAFLSAFLSLDNSFILHRLTINLHYLLGSILSFILFSGWTSPEIALFGAITLTYAAYMLKIQPCIVYTINWIPGILLGGGIGSLSLGMAILGGYWPLLIYFIPFAGLAYLHWNYALWPFLLGFLIGLPQIIPFLWYFPKSVRAKKTKNPGTFGKVPISRFLNLIWPDNQTKYINGVLSQEMALYIGLIPLIFALQSISLAWWSLLIAGLGMIGLIPNIGRIPARWCHLFTFSLVWLAVDGPTRSNLTDCVLWGLILLQAASLLRNRTYMSYWPFTEWWKRPSEWWGARPSLSNSIGRVPNLRFPYFTGYVNETRTLGYTGGFALHSLCQFHGIWNERVQTCEDERFLSGKFKGSILEELQCSTQAS